MSARYSTSTKTAARSARWPCTALSPYIDILRYGGTIPGQEKGKAEFCCSDADTIMVFEAEIVEAEKDEQEKTDKA